MSLCMVPVALRPSDNPLDPADMPDAEVVLDLEHDHYCTPQRPIQGSVRLASTHSLDCSTCRLTLEGDVKLNSKILEGIPAPGPLETHPFLRLDHPIHDHDWSLDTLHLTSASPTHVPFSFHLPAQLLASSCQHAAADEHVRHAHAQLPPSLGDRTTRHPCIDDLGPLMGQVHYSVVFRATVTSPSGAASPLAVRHHLRVMPTIRPHAPPAYGAPDPPPADEGAAPLRNALGRKMGTLTASLRPPPPVALVAPDYKASNAKIAPLAIDLLYEPSHALPSRQSSIDSAASELSSFTAPPTLPKLARADVRLTVASTVATNPMHQLSDHPGADSVTLPWYFSLFAGKPPALCWEPVAGVVPRYRARALLPVTLPIDAAIAPSFHSCHVARTYHLDIRLAARLPSTPRAPRLRLAAPLVVHAI